MDRSELFTEIATESHRPDLTSRFPQFLLRAEAMNARQLRAAEMMATETLTDTERLIPDHVYQLPSDWLEDILIRPKNRPPLEKFSSGNISYRRLSSSAAWYAVLNNRRIEIRGRPANEAEIELFYFARPLQLVNDEDTNSLIAAHPEVYIEAMLFHLYKYIQDLELAQGALDTWTEAKDTLNEQAARYQGGTVRSVMPLSAHIRSNGGY